MKVALVHDWLTGMRGGEKCLEVFCELYPNADLYTLLHVPGSVSKVIEKMRIHTSHLQKLPLSSTKYRYYLPFFPSIVDHWKPQAEAYDLVLSSSHCVAKGLRFANRRRHVCYCFTPMRYLWCQTDNYYQGNWKQSALKLIRNSLKKWDLKSNEGVDEFIGISDNVSNRIRNFYNREATTIYPPVDTDFYTLSRNNSRQDFYLMVGALEPYKRVDLAMEVFRTLNRPLKIVGKGTMLNSLKENAPSNVEFLGWRSDEEIRNLYQTARALIFPGEEDFGIVPLEAQACGCPVIAYGAGGILETVVDGETGIFFPSPTSTSLAESIEKFESKAWDPSKARIQSEKFSRSKFKQEIENYLQSDKKSGK
jgi:glycosyltransferase involved in cell wall biosynthesis